MCCCRKHPELVESKCLKFRWVHLQWEVAAATLTYASWKYILPRSWTCWRSFRNREDMCNMDWAGAARGDGLIRCCCFRRWSSEWMGDRRCLAWWTGRSTQKIVIASCPTTTAIATLFHCVLYYYSVDEYNLSLSHPVYIHISQYGSAFIEWLTEIYARIITYMLSRQYKDKIILIGVFITQQPPCG